jgi:predicted nucleic acid-binding protein
MANLVLPDSNVYIGAVRAGRDPFQPFAAALETEEWEFATCGMVVLEVCRGLRDPTILQRFRERFAVMIYLATEIPAWERAAQLAWSLDRRGIVLPAPDLLIAACALQADATVLTADAHFQEIPGLHVIYHLG